jgi:hypothetical protein
VAVIVGYWLSGAIALGIGLIGARFFFTPHAAAAAYGVSVGPDPRSERGDRRETHRTDGRRFCDACRGPAFAANVGFEELKITNGKEAQLTIGVWYRTNTFDKVDARQRLALWVYPDKINAPDADKSQQQANRRSACLVTKP